MMLFQTSRGPAPKQAQVAKALRDRGASIDDRQIAEITGLDIASVRSALARLRVALRVQQIGDGYWDLTKAGRAWLAVQEVTNG